MSADSAGSRYFFLHVMKTAGTTFVAHVLKRRFGAEERFPSPEHDVYGYDFEHSSYWRIRSLAELAPERRQRIRSYAGHFPFVATELVGGDDLVVLTILREPVERTISYLRHCKQYHEIHRALPLEEIYEDPRFFAPFISNHQTKIFSMTHEDEPRYCHDVVEIDDRRLEIAKANLERVDVVGLQERFDDFLAELEARFGWEVPATGRLREGERHDVPASLRRRIAEDNAIDLDFYEHARRLVADRRSR